MASRKEFRLIARMVACGYGLFAPTGLRPFSLQPVFPLERRMPPKRPLLGFLLRATASGTPRVVLSTSAHFAGALTQPAGASTRENNLFPGRGAKPDISKPEDPSDHLRDASLARPVLPPLHSEALILRDGLDRGFWIPFYSFECAGTAPNSMG